MILRRYGQTVQSVELDFNSKALTPDQITAIETAVNAKIAEDAPVSWGE